MVPNWKKELDALVTETIAFAASVNEKQAKQVDPQITDATGFHSDAKDKVVQVDPPVLATLDAVLAEESTAPSPLPVTPSPIPAPTTWPARLLPMTVPPSERDAIKQRLANYKAHQLKMQADRENYYSQTMTRTRELAARLRPMRGSQQSGHNAGEEALGPLKFTSLALKAGIPLARVDNQRS